ncbi:hypothetical protein EHP00_2298 [Ecytonucleospora hepatopenaei]|uniref:Uncharacterized protein n=1 Tax=Ecytonucleospora hepatopenaei TaxID=646526 RepID=A0A1W0E345_9MICR|nr:hypothetical protein EHP00_2298 [Ecytonucleospora hepatopenaei]
MLCESIDNIMDIIDVINIDNNIKYKDKIYNIINTYNSNICNTNTCNTYNTNIYNTYNTNICNINNKVYLILVKIIHLE